jgi:SPP1 family predicted phage head-tail adaptor
MAVGKVSTVGARFHLVTFQNPGAVVPDADAGFTTPWITLSPATMYVRIRTAAQNDLERVAAGTLTTTVSHIIEMPYHPQVTTATRILYGARSFNVVGVSDPEERHVSLILLVVELEGAPIIPDVGWIDQSWV